MLKPAFSTVACPHWTLDRVALAAQRLGFSGVELRTFGVDSRAFACDPALTGPEKVRRLFGQAGVSICSLATDVAFDAAVIPPVIGHLIRDQEAAVREAQRAIDIAASIECPLVRVFGFRIPANETRQNGSARIVARLRKVIDHADKTGVTVVFENGGSFAKASEMIEIIDEIRSPLLNASYNILAAHQAGENPASGIIRLGDKLRLLRVKDHKDNKPVVLGTGSVPVHHAITSASKLNAWAVFEWDYAWLPDIGEPEFALDHASRTLWQWIGNAAEPLKPTPPLQSSVY